jgi:hypothetical protein
MAKRPIPPVETLELYGPVGEITVLWGMIDHLVHYTGFAMMRVLGTTPEKVGGWPIMLGGRLAMIDKLSRNKDFATVRPTWKRLFRSLRNLQDLRDYLVHGAAARHDPKKDAVLFVRVDRATTKQLRREPDFTHFRTNLLVRFEMLQHAVGDCETLAKDFERLRQEIIALKGVRG